VGNRSSSGFYATPALFRYIFQISRTVVANISKTGIRNSHLLAIAPAGTISLLAGNVSSGLEPIFAASFSRPVLDFDGTVRTFEFINLRDGSLAPAD
jgi:ribonucleoside-diphosphate reductase alpha chain